ncbi:MAG: sigma-70 family RNA polymerase sigma factor [Elusimicrobia bacterium]|nr:sigma-70 family RNA polymerase sigma factor [Elusimicrobiota bacterium]
MEETDEQLVFKARAGDAEAFGTLVDRHQKPVAGFLLSLLGNLDLAEEAAQEAFVKAFQSIESFQGRSSFRTWVSRIAINDARSRQRWMSFRKWLPLDAARGDHGESWTHCLGDGEVEREHVERRLELERAMSDLSPREREIAALRLEGYALGEIGAVLGVSEGTIKSTLFTAVHKMKEKLS